jgi:hypothetical protein
MPGQVRIHVDVDATGHYRFQVRSGTHEITTSVNPDLAASFYEDLRLFRWKSAARLEEIGRKFMESGLPVSNSAGFTFPLTT